MDEDLPYHHVRNNTAAPLPYDDPELAFRPKRKRQRRREDASSDMIGRVDAGQQQAQTIRHQHHRAGARLPPPR